MKCWKLYLVVGMSVVGLGFSSPASAKGKKASPAVKLKAAKPFAKLKKSLRTALLKGEIPSTSYSVKMKNGKKAMVAASWAIVKKPIKTVYNEMIKFQDRYKYMPNSIKSQVVKRYNKRELHVYQVSKFWWTKIPVNIRVKLTPHTKITWALMKDKKNGIKDNLGYWVFEPLNKGKHTLISYSLYTNTGRSVPSFIKRMILRNSLPSVLKNVRKRIMSGGKWHK